MHDQLLHPLLTIFNIPSGYAFIGLNLPNFKISFTLRQIFSLTVLNNFSDNNGISMIFKVENISRHIEVYLSNVEPSDVVVITAIDEFGYSGEEKTLTLYDNVPPTTVLQSSYYKNSEGAKNNGVVDSRYGSGGELSDIISEEIIGVPYLAITPSLLDNLKADGSEAGESAGDTPDRYLKAELTDKRTRDSDDKLYFPSANIYDAVAFDKFNNNLNLARQVGVDFLKILV